MRRWGSYYALACPHNCYRVLRFLSYVLVVHAMTALPVCAKIPGKVHCYRDVCHRVMTITETERLIGSSRTVVTTYYDDPSVDRFNRGEFTSSGEKFDANNPGRAASSTFPDGTELLVWNPKNGRAGHVRINDFGPFHTNRTLDVTRALAGHLGMKRTGVVALRVTVIAAPHRGEPRYQRNRAFKGAKGYLGTYDEYELAELARELVVEGQRARLDKPLNGARMAGIPVPLQKSAARSEKRIATAAPSAGHIGGGAKLRRSSGDKIEMRVEAPGEVTRPGNGRLTEHAHLRLPPPSVVDTLLPRPPPTVTDRLLSSPPPAVTDRPRSPSPAIASSSAPIAQGPSVAAWRARGETSVAGLSESPTFPSAVWGPFMKGNFGLDAATAQSFVVAALLLVMTALSLLFLNGNASYANLGETVRYPTMKRVLEVDMGAELSLSKRAQSALKNLLPKDAPGPLIEPRRIEGSASFIGRELHLAGHLTTRSDIVLEGRIDGDCACPRIVVKNSGSVTGDIVAEEVVVQGTVAGNIRARNVCLESTARVMGEVSYCDLNVQSGAYLEARFRDESSRPLQN